MVTFSRLIDPASGFRPGFAPLLIGAVTIGLTLWAWNFTNTAESEFAQARFEARVLRINRAIDTRLTAYEQMLRAGVALTVSSDRVDRGEWRTFVEHLKIGKYYPGLLGTGFAEYIRPADRDAQIQRIQSEGFPDYQIWPVGDRADYSAIVYLEPFNERNVRAFGYDMMSEPTRRAAMVRARDANRAAMSGKVTLVQETNEDVQAGFLVYLPAYKKGLPLTTATERRDALTGWVYSPFRMNDFMWATLEQLDGIQQEIAITIHDGAEVSDDSLMFRSGASDASSRHTETVSFEHNGSVWTLNFSSLPAFEASVRRSSSDIILISGLLIALVLMVHAYLLANTRNRAVALAEEMTGALGKSEKHMRGILDNMSEGLITINDAGAIETVNPAVTEILGYPAAEMLGQNVNFLMPEPDHGQHDGYIRDYLRTGKGKILGVGGRQVTARHKNGAHVPVELTIAVLPTENSPQFIGVIRDVTERQRMGNKLRESERRFRSAFESAGHGVALVGLDGRWIDVNETLCDITGYSAEELRAIDFPSVIHPNDRESDLEKVQQLLAGEISSYQMEKRFIRKDSVEAPVILSHGLVHDSEDAPLYFVVQVIDISAWKEAETKFLQAQKMEAVGQLTGGIAHDFNNILGIALGNLQLLKRRIPDQERLSGLIDGAIGATHRGAELTRQLLAFSRRQQLNPQVVEVNRLVAGMDKILRLTLGETIAIETTFGEGLGQVKSDPAQLESAILNLALNARDAMPDGGRLIIETSEVDLDDTYLARNPFAEIGRHICISIMDTGTGIPEEIRDQIFEPFFTTKEVGKGTGLGLSMVFGFVKQSGGHINVYSEKAQGTRFRIYLPLTDEAAGEELSNKPGSDSLPGGTETVLLVEDDTQFRQTATLLLEDLGYQVVAATDGPSALKALEAAPGVDILFSDMVMPGGMNGQQVAERARDIRPGLGVLLTSGYPRGAFEDGQRYPLLSKPYNDIELARAVRAVLDGGGELGA